MTQTHARGAAVMQTWHVGFPWMLAFILTPLSLSLAVFSLTSSLLFLSRLSLCFLSETACTASRGREGKSQKRTDEAEEEKGKKKKTKKGERDWAQLLRCFLLLLFLSCKPSMCVCKCVCVCVISIFKPLHRGWLLDSLPISPTDCMKCTLGNFLSVCAHAHVYNVFHCYRGGKRARVWAHLRWLKRA